MTIRIQGKNPATLRLTPDARKALIFSPLAASYVQREIENAGFGAVAMKTFGSSFKLKIGANYISYWHQ